MLVPPIPHTEVRTQSGVLGSYMASLQVVVRVFERPGLVDGYRQVHAAHSEFRLA